MMRQGWLGRVLHSIGTLFPRRRRWLALMAILKRLARSPGGEALAEFPRWWRKLSQRNRHFVGAILVGLLIEFGVEGLHHHHIINTDFSMDWMIRMFEQTQLPKEPIPVAWVDIDEEAYGNWGEPFHIPRDRLAGLMETVLASRPKAVIVDVDLRRTGESAAADQELKKVIATAGERCATYPEEPCPRLFLPLPMREVPGEGRIQKRPSFLDSVVGRAAHAQWVTVSYERGGDGMVRHWRLWEDVVGVKNRVVVSAQLAAVCAWNGKNLRTATELLSIPKGERDNSERREVCGIEAGAGHGDVSKRVFYTTPWYPDRRERAYPPWLTHLPSSLVESADEVSALVAGKVVVLGASYSDSFDFHVTPLGTMPGALVIINSLQSLFQYGEFHPPSPWVKAAITVFLITLLSIAFTLMPGFKAPLVSSVVIILVLLPLSFWVFRTGIWLDFALPLLGVQIHDIWARIENHRHEGGHA